MNLLPTDPSTTSSTARKLLLSNLKALLSNPQYADLTLVCGARTWRLNKCIVCPRCPFLAKACDGRFLESSSSTIQLKEDDERAVQALVEYLYTGDYSHGDGDGEGEGVESMELDVLVYHLADKYLLLALKQLALARFGYNVAANWEKPEFADAVALVYDSAPDDGDDLTATISSTCKRYATRLFTQPSESSQRFQQVLRQTPALAYELATHLAQKMATLPEETLHIRCPSIVCEKFGPVTFSIPNALGVARKERIYCPSCDTGRSFAAWKACVVNAEEGKGEGSGDGRWEAGNEVDWAGDDEIIGSVRKRSGTPPTL